ncbi:MAG: hypothetical protein RR346_07555 [Bacteroidales bacterium]
MIKRLDLLEIRVSGEVVSIIVCPPGSGERGCVIDNNLGTTYYLFELNLDYI